MIQHEIELIIGLFHLVTFEETEIGATQQMVLVVHDDFVTGRVKLRRFREQFPFLVFDLFTIRLLNVVSTEAIDDVHEIFFMVAIVAEPFDSCSFKKPQENIAFALFVIFLCDVHPNI